jgi:hypothetical protein
MSLKCPHCGGEVGIIDWGKLFPDIESIRDAPENQRITYLCLTEIRVIGKPEEDDA